MIEFLADLLYWTLKGEAKPVDYPTCSEITISTYSYSNGSLVTSYAVVGPVGFYRSIDNILKGTS